MALGEILRNAREQKGVSASAVAESTHMMVQVVEDLEREDFRRVAAPIYGRGFVKLYAEYLQLDPEPLIRDFMELYAGARAPSVRTKRVEAVAEAPAECVPITRTVTGSAPTPQKQPVQARPAVRPLSVPPALHAEPDRPVVTEEPAASREAEPAAPAPAEMAGAAEPAHPAWVVDPEEAYAESDEPDLFRPQPPRRRGAEAEEGAPESAKRSGGGAKPRLPVFKIGGRLEEKGAAEPQDDAAHARRRARVDAFINGFRSLKDGVERKLPASLPRKQVLALCGAAAALLVVMGVGISVLFKLTGSSVKEAPGTVVETVAPLPDLYVD